MTNRLYQNSKNFIINSKYRGWGRKKSGLQAVENAKKNSASFSLLEDGFIRSIGLGVDNAESFSIVEDNLGIYYDATMPSTLENIFNSYDFNADTHLMQQAKIAIELIKIHNISKYNHAKIIDKDFFSDNKERVLIIAQTFGDSSLEYGLAEKFTTDAMILTAMSENKNSDIYLKIHPDVLSGKKKSDIDISQLDERVHVITDDVNAISLLKYFKKVYTKTSGMGFEALLVGCECVCFGVPFYAGWGVTDDRVSCKRRKRKLSVEEIFAGAYILYTQYYNPYRKQSSDIIDTIKAIVRYRDIKFANSGRLFFFGFSKWKREFMKPFFTSQKNEILFCNTLQEAMYLGFYRDDKAFLWGMKEYDAIIKYCEEKSIPISRVEDGFIRSISLGSDLTRPYSLVVDSRGIYIDPSKESDLEHILSTFSFDDAIRQRAKNLIEKIVSSKFSKYNSFSHKKLSLNAKEGEKVILIPAQVEDDASIRYGGMGMDTLMLLQEVREKNPSAYILFKPHPDVLSGNRKGLKKKEIILEYCDDIIENASIDSCIDVCDEVHTITSTAGFDTLIRDKKVFTYGTPFYAGWGLTNDKHINKRRNRKLTLFELVAGTLILYPRYISPKTKKLCEVEVAFDEMIEIQRKYFEIFWYSFLIDSRMFVLRRVRRIIEFMLQLLGKR